MTREKLLEAGDVDRGDDFEKLRIVENSINSLYVPIFLERDRR